MLKCRKMISALMAVLMLTLSFVVVLADDADDAMPTRTSLVSGNYNGCSYTFSSTGASSALLKCSGSYEVEANIKFKFQTRVCYWSVDGVATYYGTVKSKTYGPYYGTYLTKSYTMSQWGTAVGLSGIPYGSFFPYGNYFMYLDNALAATISDTYVSV